MAKAYGVKAYQVFGPPAIDSEKFDIVAKIPPGTTEAQYAAMLQSLLAERFGLVVHREMRELPLYELVVAKGGLKMKAPEKAPDGAAEPERNADGRTTNMHMSRDASGLPELPPGFPAMFGFSLNGNQRITARMQTVARLLQLLDNQIGRPVVDKTGLTGIYDFNLFWAGETARVAGAGSAASPEQPTVNGGLTEPGSDPAPSLEAAFESQLGLKLEPKKGPVEALVVDKVNKTPTEN